MIEALHKLVPASAAIVTSVSMMTADNVLKSLDEQELDFKFYD